jgi:isoquinoline 1-oxidoreductase subunit beta
MALHRMEGGLDADGKPVALTFQLTSQSVTERAFGLPKGALDPFMTEASVVPYRIPNMQQDLINHDAGLRVGYWRSVSHALNAFANESFVDELAAAAGKDPYAYRMSLLDPQSRLANVARLAADKAGWGTPLATGHAHGIALMEGYDSHLAMVLEVTRDGDDIQVKRAVVAVDVGHMVNPDTVQAQVHSSVVFGLSAALADQVTLVKGRVQQRNFDSYPVLRMYQMPQVDVILVQSTEKPGGVGEPVTAMVAPALGNALFVLTGKRVRQVPFTAENIASA